ncbi:MAG: calcium-binding protein, partial [Xanthobacteraceae bacterium]
NLFLGLAGNESRDGGDGVDTVDYSLDFFLQGGAGVVDNLGSSDVDFGAPGVVAANSATDGFGDADALFNIENVFGTGQADTIVGNAAGNTLLGLGGNDRLAGGAGNDLLDGGVGTQDQADYSLDAGLGGGAGVTVDLAAGTATDGFGSTDTLANIEWVVGTNEADGISGNAASNRFEGLAGSDTLDGRGGSDVLNGGAGDDILIGGGDDDLFVFEDGTGNDTVTDYAPGADRLDVSAFYADFATLETQIEDVDGNAVIHLDADDSVTLIGIQKVQLQSTDFVFLDG